MIDLSVAQGWWMIFILAVAVIWFDWLLNMRHTDDDDNS